VVETGKWIHVAGVYDGAMMRLYVDGVEVASQAKSGALRIGSAPVYVGENPVDTVRPFDGVIDGVIVYARSLSGIELEELSARSRPTAPTNLRVVFQN
jgi:hypothetical protein